jgi:hypothetical protein
VSLAAAAPTLTHYLVLGAILFAISMAGIFLNRRNVIIVLMSIELMLLAIGDRYEKQIAEDREADARYR